MKKILLGASILFLGTISISYASPSYTFTKSLLPETNDTYYLGSTSPALRWKGGVFKDLTVTGTCTGCGGGGAGNPAGSNGQIQYNNSGSFGATSSLSYSTLTNTLSLGDNVTTVAPVILLQKDPSQTNRAKIESGNISGLDQEGSITFANGSNAHMDILGGDNNQLRIGSDSGVSIYGNQGTTPSGIPEIFVGNRVVGIGTVGPTSDLHIQDNLIDGPGSLTDNGDDTVSFTDNINGVLSVGYFIYDLDLECGATITEILDSFTIVKSGYLCGGSGDTWQYTPNSLFKAVNAFGTSRMHVTGDGVGIGTDSPTEPLTISTGDTNGLDTVSINQTSAATGNIYSNLVFKNTNGLIGNIFELGAGYNQAALFTANDFGFLGGQGYSSTSIVFMTNTLGDIKFGAGGYATGNEIMRVHHNGNVGVGTTTPWKKLSVTGNVSVTGSYFDSTGSAGSAGNILMSTNTGTKWVATSSVATLMNATSTAVLVGKTASIDSVNSYTPTASSTFAIYATTDVTAEAVQTLTVSVTYTDTGGTSRTQNFFGMGLTTAAIGSTGDSNFPPMIIRPLKNTIITVSTTVGGVGSITYNIDASIVPISTQ